MSEILAELLTDVKNIWADVKSQLAVVDTKLSSIKKILELNSRKPPEDNSKAEQSLEKFSDIDDEESPSAKLPPTPTPDEKVFRSPDNTPRGRGRPKKVKNLFVKYSN